MITEYKIILRDIVEMFYQPPFKIFNVNSIDGKTIVKPFGYFISLGITTSLDVLNNIKNYISKSDYGFDAKLVELESIRSEEYGDFLNVLSDIPEDKIKKYRSTPPENIKVYDKKEVDELLESYNKKIESGDYSCSLKKKELLDLTKKINSWDDHCIQEKDNVLGIFHKFVNYKKTDKAEFRIGIYVTKI